MVSYREGDVVNVVKSTGETPHHGVVDALDNAWGVAVVFEDGSREWFAYELWCPLQFEKGFSMVLADEANFRPVDGFATPPEEVGRGWLPRPPKKKGRQTTIRPLSSSTSTAAMSTATDTGTGAARPYVATCIEGRDDPGVSGDLELCELVCEPALA